MGCKLLLVLCIVAFPGYVYSQDDTWSYSGENGPEFWSTIPSGALCNGSMQSPIDLSRTYATPKGFEPWTSSGWDEASLDGPHPSSIVNLGTRALITLAGEYIVAGGGLPSTYKGVQMDVHIGAESDRGSEHTVDGKQYPGELHVGLYDIVKYGTLEEAIPEPEGVAVFGWFLEEGDYNPYWEPVIKALSEIKYAGSSYEFETPFIVGALFPLTFDKFYRYNGSIPLPPCLETLSWTMFEDTIKMSPEQIAEFRTLSRLSEESPDGREDPMVDNFRPVQPLNDRTVYAGYIEYPATEEESCSERCNQVDVDSNFTCQCNAPCRRYEDCCEDYADNCLIELCSYVHSKNPDKMRKQPRQQTDIRE